MTGRWASSNRRSELPPDWHKIRARILRRDGHRCTWIENGHSCGAPATDVDHVADPLDHSEANLRSLCDPHHKRKTQAEAQAARARLVALRRRPVDAHPGLRRSGPPGGGPPTPPPG